ncbi:MAG: hypothetical protein MAG431_02032 [Chloroflexi bacterium]|nr:hypothetical protein [Chloroflexota bacterium]
MILVRDKEDNLVVKAGIQEVHDLEVPALEEAEVWPDTTQVKNVIARLVWTRLKLSLPDKVEGFKPKAIRVSTTKDGMVHFSLEIS